MQWGNGPLSARPSPRAFPGQQLEVVWNGHRNLLGSEAEVFSPDVIWGFRVLGRVLGAVHGSTVHFPNQFALSVGITHCSRCPLRLFCFSGLPTGFQLNIPTHVLSIFSRLDDTAHSFRGPSLRLLFSRCLSVLESSVARHCVASDAGQCWHSSGTVLICDAFL